MKKYNKPMDDFFRESLADHRITPSAEAKKAFMKDAMQLPPPGKRNWKVLILLSAFIILTGTGIVIWSVSDNGSISIPVNTSLQAVPTSVGIQTSHGTQTEIHTEIASTQDKTVGSVHARTDPPADPGLDRNDNNIPGLTLTDREPAGKATPLKTVATTSPAPDTLTVVTDTSMAPENHINKKPEKTVKTAGKFNPAIGFYYTPEWMFQTLEGTKFVNNFGIEASFSFGRFSIRTGAGLSIAKGSNELVVEYNDYLGAYNKLDSMDFTWSEPMKDYIPTLYTSRNDVWDSLMKLDYAKVIKRYTYLQFPLVMGYDFWQTERVSFGVRVGPVLSVLVSTKQLSAAYDPGQKRIISMNDIAPEQINLNWQVLGGLNTKIWISETLQFEIEPAVRYYFNSVYEQPVNNAKPWSVGLRAAFVIKL